MNQSINRVVGWAKKENDMKELIEKDENSSGGILNQER